MTGRERIEAAAQATGFTDRPDTDHGGWAQAEQIRRYRKGSRRVTVSYDLHGRVIEIWTARSHRGASHPDKAAWVINYLNGAN